MKIFKLSQSVNPSQESIQKAQGEYLNQFTQNYNRIVMTLDSAMGELKSMSNNLVSDNNFLDIGKTTEYYIGDNGNGGKLGELLNKMTDVQKKFNVLKEFLAKQPTPVEKSQLLDQVNKNVESVQDPNTNQNTL
jgi:hypothetical protein